MKGNARVGMITIAILALALGRASTQGQTDGQKPPEAKPAQATTSDTQVKPADTKGDALQEDLPADFKAFNDAGKEKDLVKRVEAYEKFIADHPKSVLVATARTQIQSTLLAALKTAQVKYLDVMQQQVETAKKGTSASALSSTYSRLASSLLSAGVLLDQAEEYARSALSLMDEAKYVQERTEVAQRAADAFAKRAAEKPATEAAVPTPPPTSGFSMSMVDGVPFAKPLAPRPPTTAVTRPATLPTAPRVPTGDEIRTSFRAEKASVQSTLGQILVRRGKTAEGEAMLKEALAARPAAAAMATIARVLAESAKRAGNDGARLEYLSELALSGRISKNEQQDLEALYRESHSGSIDGLEAMLDQRFLRTATKVEVKPSTREVKPTDRAVLAEMFAGAG